MATIAETPYARIGTTHEIGRSTGRDIFSAADPLRAALARVRRMTAPRPPNDEEGGVAHSDEGADRLAAALPLQPRVYPDNRLVVVIAGFGTAGVAIAGEMLRRGCTVHVFEALPFVRNCARVRLARDIREHVDKGLLLEEDVDFLMSRFSVKATLAEALMGSRFVIEAIRENAEDKRAFYVELTSLCSSIGVSPGSMLLGTNSLNISMKDITEGLQEEWAARVIGLRVLFPSWFIDEVEFTMGYQWCAYTGPPTSRVSQYTSQPAYNEAEMLMRSLGFRLVRFVGTRRCIDTDDLSAYELRQRRQCIADRSEVAQRREGNSPVDSAPNQVVPSFEDAGAEASTSYASPTRPGGHSLQVPEQAPLSWLERMF